MGQVKCYNIANRLYIPYEDKRFLAYLVGGLTTVFGTVLFGLVATQKLDDESCLSFSYVYSLELPLLTVILMVYYIATFAFFWGVWQEKSKYILPFFCLLVATVGFIGHAHVERMLFEVGEDERRFVIAAFIFTTGMLVFASAITLLLYREMSSTRQDKVEYLEMFVADGKF
ncbi:uncharacterized protein LOC129770072 [Toxorhynchites rutilus septentrionalis]|uniref:uncharacterized protein LOC129770072 n=1 Tax=Toxorhynchites rutilus septentrionalis TaxID=329112 RepID=UPI0024797013|nr:uncharacterized protein LOC129770072 [Toxorhynchites rutilus septentrionalis]